jgi:hypothetical protein
LLLYLSLGQEWNLQIYIMKYITHDSEQIQQKVLYMDFVLHTLLWSTPADKAAYAFSEYIKNTRFLTCNIALNSLNKAGWEEWRYYS